MFQAATFNNKQVQDALVILLVAVALMTIVKHRFASYDVANIEVAQARAMINGGALVLDVRGADSYAEGHIEGAISVPLETLETAIPEQLESAREQDIVVYCGDGVTRGPKATAILNEAGYAKAVNLKPGIKAWESAGYAMAQRGT